MQEKLKQISWLMVTLLVIMVLPAFFVFPAQPKKEMVRVKPKAVYYSVIPNQAVALSTLTSYKDRDLTIKSDSINARTRLSIKTIVDKGKKKLFLLNDNSYVLASTKTIGSDVVLTVKKLSTTVYTASTVKVLYAPFTVDNQQVYTTLPANQSLQTLKKATTHWGTYYEVSFDDGPTGWVSSTSVSLENPKLISLQKLLDQRYNNSNYSITVKQLDSKFTIGVNQNKEMYSASLSKLPILYWTQKRINNGQATPNDRLKYIPAVNDESWGAFNPNGTGQLPKTANNRDYPLLDIVNFTAKDSDNVGSNLLAYYETDKFSSSYRTTINKLAGEDWDPSQRNASSAMVTRVIEALYDKGGICFNSLFNTSYDNSKIKAGIPANIKVAHKIGIADGYNHDAAIVFTPQPYILVIETKGDTPDSVLTQISKLVYGVLK